MIKIFLNNFRVVGHEGDVSHYNFETSENEFKISAVSKDGYYSMEYILTPKGYTHKTWTSKFRWITLDKSRNFDNEGSGVIKIFGGPLSKRTINFVDQRNIDFLGQYNISSIKVFGSFLDTMFKAAVNRRDNKISDIIVPNSSSVQLWTNDYDSNGYSIRANIPEIKNMDFRISAEKDLSIRVNIESSNFIIFDEYIEVRTEKIVKRTLWLAPHIPMFSCRENLDKLKEKGLLKLRPGYVERS